jgi:hypothetical protein
MYFIDQSNKYKKSVFLSITNEQDYYINATLFEHLYFMELQCIKGRLSINSNFIISIDPDTKDTKDTNYYDINCINNIQLEFDEDKYNLIIELTNNEAKYYKIIIDLYAYYEEINIIKNIILLYIEKY